MRKFLLACLFLLFTCYGVIFAQNKTLGVGVTAPNPNAALHVESPTANQGFIMPRLSTLQRNAMTSLLTLSDKGLMLYDTDLNTVYIWDGVAWKSSAQVSGGPKLVLPYADTVSIALGANPNLLNLVYAGGSETVAVARFQNLNARSKNPALWVESNSDSALSAPIYGLNTGTGDAAGVFRINNSASTVSALFAETNGSGPAIYGNQIGMGRGGQFQITNALNNNAAVRGFTSGTGYAGFYTINNPANTSAGIYSATNGGGAAFFGETTGTGPAATFIIKNAGNASSGIISQTNGTGAAITAENTGAANGFAGVFTITSASNNYPAIQASSAGAASGLRVMQTTGTGAGVDVFIQNASSSAPGMAVDQGGLGNAGSFLITNTESGSPAVNAITNGTGAALEAKTSTGFTAVYGRHEGAGNGNAGLFEITGNSNTYPALQANTAGTGYAINARHTGTSGDAIYAEHAGAANGSAGNFRISNPENKASSLFAATNASGGTAVGASNEANGIAFAVWSGGIKITTHVVTTASITTRASAYRIMGGGLTFSLDFGPSDGEVFMMINETGQNITIAGIGLQTGEGKTFVVFPGGIIRGF